MTRTITAEWATENLSNPLLPDYYKPLPSQTEDSVIRGLCICNYKDTIRLKVEAIERLRELVGLVHVGMM
jgi:hypothetical protein